MPDHGPRISVIGRFPQDPAASGVARSAGTMLAVAFLAAYPLLFLIQGIDFTDMGFNLSNQWLLLEDARSYQHGHLFYLSNLLGGLWLSISSPLGLLGAKLGWALLIYATMYAAYRTLEPYGSRAGLLAGLVIAVLWNTRIGTSWISYNSLTALFFTCAAFFLVRGLTGEHKPSVLVAGALLAAATFVRFPNLLAFALVAVIPLYAHLARRERAWTLRHGGCFLLGYAGGAAFVLLLMLVLGHLPLYLESIDARFSASVTNEDYAYSGGKLIGLLFLDHERLVKTTAIALPLFLVAAWVLSARWRWQLAGFIGIAALWYALVGQVFIDPWWFIAALLVGVLAQASLFWTRHVVGDSPLQIVPFVVGIAMLMMLGFYFTRFQWTWLVPGMLYATLAFRYWRVRSADDRLVTVVAAMLMATTPLGSSNGMVNAIFGMWLAIPLALMTLVDELRAGVARPWYRRGALVITAVACTSMVLVALGNASQAAYRDSKDRTRMTVSSIHPFLRGVLTTPERAQVVDELMSVLPDYAAPGDPLLLHDCPLLHLLSRTRPVLGSTWNGVYDENMFINRLRAFEQSGPTYPVVLLSKGSCRVREWPVRKGISLTGFNTGREVHEYMSRHAYRLRWQNAFFEIWVPPPSDSQEGTG